MYILPTNKKKERGNPLLGVHHISIFYMFKPSLTHFTSKYVTKIKRKLSPRTLILSDHGNSTI